MASRKKFKIVGVIRAYNLVLMFINIYFFVNVAKRTYLSGTYNWLCQGVGRSKKNLAVVELLYRFMFVRIFELLDTVFFVLRKKFKHASFRNVSHHVIAIFIPWYGIAYGIDGQTCLTTLINMAVHIVIYLYYFLASFEEYKPYLWWKRYLTYVQVGQFAVIIAHMAVPLVYDCGYPALNSLIIISAYVYFLVMFKAFYGTTYRSGDRQSEFSVGVDSSLSASPSRTRQHYSRNFGL